MAANGSVYAFGDAKYSGSRGGLWIDGAVVGIAVDPTTGGYWVVTSRGAVYAEDAPDYGSPATHHLPSPIVAMAAAPHGSGYWLAASNGRVYSYGAAFHGSASNRHLWSPVVGIAASSSGNGYWLASADGTILRFGNVGSYGKVPAEAHSEPITAFSSVP